jgi:hypothetical protein
MKMRYIHPELGDYIAISGQVVVCMRHNLVVLYKVLQ